MSSQHAHSFLNNVWFLSVCKLFGDHFINILGTSCMIKIDNERRN